MLPIVEKFLRVNNTNTKSSLRLLPISLQVGTRHAVSDDPKGQKTRKAKRLEYLELLAPIGRQTEKLDKRRAPDSPSLLPIPYLQHTINIL